MSDLFLETVDKYHTAARAAVELRATADEAFARALVAADGKSEAVRKAQAELAASAAQRAAALAEADAAALRHVVIYLRGDNGRAELERDR
jgi:hypothetical protein